MPDSFMNMRTGDVTDNVTRLVTLEEQNRNSNFSKNLKKHKQINKLIYQHCGGFFFYKYTDLLDVVEGNTAIAFRFIYLCACADKDGRFIKYGNEYCRTRDDFTYIFDKPLRSTRNYVDELCKYGLIGKTEQTYKLNPDYYSCGILDDTFKKQSVRTFRNAIKDLYNNSNPNEHSTIGELLKFIPYLNIYNNTLCWYTEESSVDKMQPLTIQEIRHILRQNSYYGYVVEEKLEELFVKGEPVFGKFEAAGEYHYIINPRLLYRGNDARDLQKVIDHFDISKYQYLNKINKKRKEMGKN